MKKTQHKKNPPRYFISTVSKIVNEKGTTVEWCKGLPGKQISIYYRDKGSSFAQHYHTGKDASKNPERFFLISGKVQFWIEVSDHCIVQETLLPGQEMLIYPFVKHQAVALEDSIFIEYRSTVFSVDMNDTIPIPSLIDQI